MGAHIFPLVLSAIIGIVAGLLETWGRGDAIPNFRILAVGLIAALGAGLLSILIFGGLIIWFPVILAPAALLIDRAAADARRGL